MLKKVIRFLKEDNPAWTILCAGFVLRICYIFLFTTPEQYLFSDPGGYDSRALLMAKGQYVMSSTYWPPFFHIFLSFIYRPVLWLGLESWRIKIDVVIFALFYMAAFWLIYRIVEKLFSKKRALIILFVLTLWYPLVFFNYLVMSENLFFLLLFLGFYILITKPQSALNGLWLGVCWGFALITRPILAPAIPLFFIWALYYKLNWKFLTNFAVAAIAVTGSMMLFNNHYTDGAERSFSSNGGIGFAALWCDAKSIQYNLKGYGWGFGWPGNIDYPNNTRIFTDVPFENQKYYYKMGFDCLKKHPERFIANLASVFKLFDSHLFPTIGSVAGWEKFRLIFKALTGLMFFISLSTVFWILKGRIEIKEDNKKYFYLFSLIILSLFASLYLQNPGEERYIIPYSPLLMILCLPTFNKCME